MIAIMATLCMACGQQSIDNKAKSLAAVISDAQSDYLNGIKIKDDSLLRKAVIKFQDRQDSLGLQSLFLYGLIHFSNHNLDSALVSLTQMHQKAEANKNYYYAALSAQELSKVYGSLLILEKQSEFALNARRNYRLAGHPEMSAKADLEHINALIFMANFDEAQKKINEFSATYKNLDNKTLARLRIDQSSLFYLQKNIPAAKKILEELLAKQPDMGSRLWSRLGHYYLEENRINDALSARDSAQKYLSTNQDSLYFGLLEAMICGKQGNYRDGYQKALDWGYLIMEDGDKKLCSPKTLLLTDYLTAIAEKEHLEKQRVTTRNIYLTIGCAVLLLIVLLVSLYYRSRLQLKKASEEMLLSHVSALEHDISMHSEASNQLHDEIKNLFHDNLNIITNLCEVWYRAEDSDEKTGLLRKGIREALKQLQTEHNFNSMTKLIDLHENDWFQRFSNAFPDLKDKQYRLAVYMYLGFSNDAIAAMMDKKTLNAVYIDKHKLKSALVKTGNPEADNFIRDLKLC